MRPRRRLALRVIAVRGSVRVPTRTLSSHQGQTVTYTGHAPPGAGRSLQRGLLAALHIDDGIAEDVSGGDDMAGGWWSKDKEEEEERTPPDCASKRLSSVSPI